MSINQPIGRDGAGRFVPLQRSDDIVGYQYRADLYCPSCIVLVLPTGSGERFDGWGLAPGASMSAEEFLAGVAQAFGIDALDESSFDSGDFPKVVFRDQAEPGDGCGRCHEPLDD